MGSPWTNLNKNLDWLCKCQTCCFRLRGSISSFELVGFCLTSFSNISFIIAATSFPSSSFCRDSNFCSHWAISPSTTKSSESGCMLGTVCSSWEMMRNKKGTKAHEDCGAPAGQLSLWGAFPLKVTLLKNVPWDICSALKTRQGKHDRGLLRLHTHYVGAGTDNTNWFVNKGTWMTWA